MPQSWLPIGARKQIAEMERTEGVTRKTGIENAKWRFSKTGGQETVETDLSIMIPDPLVFI